MSVTKVVYELIDDENTLPSQFSSALAIIAIVIIGLLDFDLMLEIWVKVLIGVIFIGVIFTMVRCFME